MKTTIEEIANIEGLTLIETTIGANGSPSQLQHALIGFDSWGHLVKVKEQYNLITFEAFRKDGWTLYNRRNVDGMREPYYICFADYGDNYGQFPGNMDEEIFFKEEIKPILENANIKTLNDLDELLQPKREIWNEIDKAEDCELVITRDGHYYETINEVCMSFSHDTIHVAIGLIEGR